MTLKMHLHELYMIEVAPACRPSRGRWWREGCAGYTNLIAEAGLYSKDEATHAARAPDHVMRPAAEVLAELGKGVVKAEKARSDRDWERMKETWRREA